MNNEKYNFELFESKKENIKPIRFAKSPQDIPMKDRASKPKKRSFIKRTAAFLTAGAIALGAYTLIHNHNDKLPEESEYIHNAVIDMDTSNEATLASLEEEFSSLSENSSSSEINDVAKKLYDFNMKYLKSEISSIYNNHESLDASSIKIYRELINSQADPSYSYYAEIFNSYSTTPHKIHLGGKELENIIDNIVNLQDFDVYHDGYKNFEKYAKSTFETLNKDFIISYNKKERSMTSYEIEQDRPSSNGTSNVNKETEPDR